MASQTRIQIPNELFAPAESLHFEGVLDLRELQAGPDTYAFLEPVAWSAQISNVGDALLVSGIAQGNARTACSRCLVDTEYELVGELEGYFIIEQDAEAPDDLEGDEFEYLGDDGIIDMEPIIISALLMDIPLQPLCSDDCKGLCPMCGCNLNSETCSCAASGQPDPIRPDNPFAVLSGYTFDEELFGVRSLKLP